MLVRRLPRGEAVALDRSRCEACGHVLGARELVPLLSFAVQRGRCRGCGAAIGWFHPLVELAALVVALSAVPSAPDAAALWADCVLGWGLLALALIDLEHMLLPDVLTLPLVVLGLGATALLVPEAVTGHAAGAVLGWAGLRLVGLVHRRLRGHEGLGGGDAKLMAVAGAWVGAAGLPLVLFLGSVLGLALLAPPALLRHGPGSWRTVRVPFGPALALGIWLVRLHGAWLAALMMG